MDEILNHSVGPDQYHRDDALKQQIITHYRLNMRRIVKLARDAGAGVILVQPASNIKDMSPFKSEHREGLDEATLEQWERLYKRAEELQHAGQLQQALAVYREAQALDDRYAELHYRTGQLLFELKRYPAAQQAFARALEEDVAPLRMLGAMQRIVEQVAAAEQVPLIDFPAIIRDAYLSQYDHAVFGREYFPDHVHTNMEGYRLLGLALFELLVRQGIARPAPDWNAARIEAVRQEVIAGLDPGIEGRAVLTMGRVLDWAGKHSEALELFKRARETLGPSPRLYDRLARSAFILGRVDETIEYLRETLDLYPQLPGVNSRLAMLLQKQRKIDEAIHHCRAELEINPTDHYVHAGLANLLEMKGDADAALRHYEIALQIKPDYEYVLVKLAELLIYSQRYDDALAHTEKALRINPEQYRAHRALAVILEKRGESQQAAHHFAEAQRLETALRVARQQAEAEPAGPAAAAAGMQPVE